MTEIELITGEKIVIKSYTIEDGLLTYKNSNYVISIPIVNIFKIKTKTKTETK